MTTTSLTSAEPETDKVDPANGRAAQVVALEVESAEVKVNEKEHEHSFEIPAPLSIAWFGAPETASYIRWDWLYAMYIGSIFITGFAFALGYDGRFYGGIFVCGYLHFACEMSVAWYLCGYSVRTTRILCLVTWAVCIIGAVCSLPLPSVFSAVFAVLFVASDTFSMLTALCVQFNPHLHRRMAILGTAVTPHVLSGILLKLCLLPHELYVKNRTPFHGSVWYLLIVMSVSQIYFARDIIRGRLNHHGRITFSSDCWRRMAQIAVPIAGLVVIPVAFFLLGVFRTTKNETDNYYALGLWLQLINTTAWFIASCGLIYLLHLWSQSHPLTLTLSLSRKD